MFLQSRMCQKEYERLRIPLKSGLKQITGQSRFNLPSFVEHDLKFDQIDWNRQAPVCNDCCCGAAHVYFAEHVFELIIKHSAGLTDTKLKNTDKMLTFILLLHTECFLSRMLVNFVCVSGEHPL